MSGLTPMGEGPRFEAARIEDLAAVMGYVDAACEGAGVPAEAAFAVRLAVEEAFTNIVKHAYADSPGPVRLELSIDGTEVTVRLIDAAPLFDPAQAPPPDLDSDWDDRVEGGLGWHLVHQLMDEVRHEPAPGAGNIVTMIKRLPSAAS